MKKMLLSLLQTIIVIYLAIAGLMYFTQRSILYYPVPSPEQFNEQKISFTNGAQSLQGWVLNPGKSNAVIYFGGNAEQVEQNSNAFDRQLSDYTVYLIPYRGYGNNNGSPTEQGLFSDALYVFDKLKTQHQSLSVIGRSLGSGVATYVAANRDVDRMVLLTPYDSIANVAQGHYPFLPVGWLLKDKYESFKRADKVKADTLVVIAGQDQVVPPKHAHELIKHFTNAQVQELLIEPANHNNVSAYPEFDQTFIRFMAL